MGSEDAKVVYADQLSVSLVVHGRRGKTGRRKPRLIMSTGTSRPPETAAGAADPSLLSALSPTPPRDRKASTFPPLP